jgi:hypothetical protein
MNHFKTPNQDIEKMVADGKEVLQFWDHFNCFVL